jgi:hypothetical protein
MSHNGRHGRVILPYEVDEHGIRPAALTKEDVRALIVELIGSLAHSQVELERKLAALEAYLGVSYNPTVATPDGLNAATPAGEVPENAGGDVAHISDTPVEDVPWMNSQ